MGTEAVDESRAHNAGERVVSYPAGFAAGVMAISLLVGVIFITRGQYDRLVYPCIISAVTVLPCLRWRIVADSQGIEWRTWIRTRRAGWNDVTDYYLHPMRNGSREGSHQRAIIETRFGDIALSSNWTAYERIRAAVRDRAHSARSASWGVRGARNEDPWPRVFEYDRRAIRRERWQMIAMTVVGVLCFAYLCLLNAHKQHASGVPLRDVLLFSIPFAVLMLTIIPAGPILHLGRIAESRRRQRHRITLTPEELRFDDGMQQVTAIKWQDVSATYKTTVGRFVEYPNLYVVESPHGRITFTSGIRTVTALLRNIDALARNRSLTRWADEESVRGAALSAGARRFDMRTRDMRACLLGLTVLPIAVAVLMLLDRYLGKSDAFDKWPAPAAFAAASLVGWTWYFRMAVVTDERGVTRHSLFGSRTILWHEITRIARASDEKKDTITIEAGSRRIKVPTGISRQGLLEEELTRRAGNVWQESDRV